MIYYKSCIRCQGDLHVKIDLEGAYAACLACGAVTYPEIGAPRKQRIWRETTTWRPSRIIVAKELVAQG